MEINGKEGSRKMLLGRCPKCGGNLFLDKDASGWFTQCLQCSQTREVGEQKLMQPSYAGQSNYNMGGDHLMTSRHKSGRYE
jgi:hypothetical protein